LAAAQVNPSVCAAPANNPNSLTSRLPAAYSHHDPANMNELLTRMTPDEIRDGVWLVGVVERWGSMSQDEADEWRRRIEARRRFLDLNATGSPIA